MEPAKSRTRLLAGLLIVAFAAIGWLLWERADRDGSAADGAGRGTELAAAVLETEAIRDGDPPRVAPHGHASGRVAAPEAGGAVAVSGAPADPRARVLVHVLDADTQQPVPQASVWVLPSDASAAAPADLELVREKDSDMQAWVERFGRRFETDSNGAVEIPAEAPWSQVVARAGVRIGSTSIDGRPRYDAAGPQILLAPERLLAFRVVHREEAVAGIIVELRAGARSERVLWSRESDAHGQVLWRCAVVPVPARVTVALRLPGSREQHAREVPLAPWPTEEIVLEAPGSGAAEVRLTGTAPAGREVALAALEPEPAARPHVERVGRDGRALFRQLALGRRYVAWLVGRESVRCEFAGPSREGEVVHASLRVLESEPRLRLRVVDPTASPVPSAVVRAVITLAKERIQVQATTDTAGILELLLPDRAGEQVVRHVELCVEPHRRRPAMQGRLDLDRVVPRGVQLPDPVSVCPAPVVAAGKIRGIEGHCLLDAECTLEASGIPASPDGRWERVKDASLIWPEPSTFQIHASTEFDRLRVSWRGAAIAPHAPLEFRRGSLELEFLLRACGSLELPIRCDAGVAFDALGARLTALEGQVLPDHARLVAEGFRSARVGPDTLVLEALDLQAVGEDPPMLQWSHLAPGRYRIEVFTGGSGGTVLASRELHARAGTTVRTDPIDLRGRLKRVRIAVRDESGALLPGHQAAHVCHTRAADPGARRTHATVPVVAGIAELVLAEPTDLVVQAIGRPPVELPRVFADQTVQLRAGTVVRVRFDTSKLPQFARESLCVCLELRHEPTYRHLGAQLEPRVPPPMASLPPGPQPVPDDGIVSWSVAVPGSYWIRALEGVRLGEPARFDPPVLRVSGGRRQEFRVEVR